MILTVELSVKNKVFKKICTLVAVYVEIAMA